jgi:competence ComEA-like helix-hairpin-helix protein
MAETRRNIVLLLSAILLTFLLFQKGHDKSAPRDVVAFLPDGRVVDRVAVIRLAGDVCNAGIYQYNPGIDRHSVINMTVPHLSVGRNKLERVLQRVPSGSVVTVVAKGVEIIEVNENKMDACELMTLGVPLNVNMLNRHDWEALPGIGRKTAEKILDYRQKYGDFSSLAELEAVPGIGKATLKKIAIYFADR